MQKSKFTDKVIRFMYGRNGNDMLNRALFWVYFVLLLFNILLKSTILWILELILVALYMFRFFSRNIYRRQKENRAFLKVWNKITGFFKLQRNKIRDRKTHVYRKCEHCHVTLRLPKKNGKHTVRCPQCGKTFSVKI
jgi:predicted RNA-binding Zn-ribbon protein involved in translation (DUF1610 family)